MRLPGKDTGDGMQQMKTETLWTMARAYAEANGLKHNYANVEGIAPL